MKDMLPHERTEVADRGGQSGLKGLQRHFVKGHHQLNQIVDGHLDINMFAFDTGKEALPAFVFEGGKEDVILPVDVFLHRVEMLDNMVQPHQFNAGGRKMFGFSDGVGDIFQVGQKTPHEFMFGHDFSENMIFRQTRTQS
jgi:hypothetical protein